ncbi:MAG: S26 family signal peptidase [Polyangiaceae bacterium]
MKSPRRALTARELETLLVRATFATACASALACLVGSHLLWNWTPSLPLGLYWISGGAERPSRGDLVAFPVPQAVRELVEQRRYLPPDALLVKPIVAGEDDRVCTEGGTLTVNGVPFGAIATEDTHGRPLPHPDVCGPLPTGLLYVASRCPTSFDSRSFGAVPVGAIRGRVTPLWTY